MDYNSDDPRRSEGWLGAIACGSRAAIEGSWEVVRDLLRQAIRRSYERSILAGTAYTRDDILWRTHGWAILSPGWLISGRSAAPADPSLAIWWAWLEATEEVLRGVAHRYEQVWGSPEGLVPQLIRHDDRHDEGHLVKVARKILDHHSVADDPSDVVAEAVQKLLHHRGGAVFRGPILDDPAVDIESRLRPILFNKVKNEAFDRVRARRWPQPLGEYETAYGDDSRDRDGDLADRIDRVFARLANDESLARLIAEHRIDEATGRVRQLGKVAQEIERPKGEVERIAGRLKREAIRSLPRPRRPRRPHHPPIEQTRSSKKPT